MGVSCSQKMTVFLPFFADAGVGFGLSLPRPGFRNAETWLSVVEAMRRRARGPVETGEEQTLPQFWPGKFAGRTNEMRSPRAAPGRICLRALDRVAADGTSCISARPRGCEGWFSVTAGDRLNTTNPAFAGTGGLQRLADRRYKLEVDPDRGLPRRRDRGCSAAGIPGATGSGSSLDALRPRPRPICLASPDRRSE
jgi:hypothetical protein